MSASISSPMFLIGRYLNLFDHAVSLCKAATIHRLTVHVGMITSLAYASIERHFLIFRKNGLLTWGRQLLPVMCILIYSYIIAILFTLMPTCTYSQCIGCYTTQLYYMIPWLIISFFVPQSLMIISTVFLLIRLKRRITNFNRRPERSGLWRIFIQMSIYVFWSCLYYCPTMFYSFSLIIDPSVFSTNLKIAIDISDVVILHTYPILTFISMLLLTRRKQIRQQQLSNLQLNTITTSPKDG